MFKDSRTKKRRKDVDSDFRRNGREVAREGREKEGHTLTLILSGTQGVPAIPCPLMRGQCMGRGELAARTSLQRVKAVGEANTFCKF
jgi:hypothetical protein